MPNSRVTFQHIFLPDVDLDPVPQRDVRADWSGPLAPPVILLDFAYGVAVVRHYAVAGFRQLLNEHHNNHFENIPLVPPSGPADQDEGEDEGDNEQDDVRRYRTHHKSEESEFSRVMDRMLSIGLLFRGLPKGLPTPGEIEEERSRQQGQKKVQKWLEVGTPTIDTPSSF